jgi:hypothetical protein
MIVMKFRARGREQFAVGEKFISGAGARRKPNLTLRRLCLHKDCSLSPIITCVQTKA